MRKITKYPSYPRNTRGQFHGIVISCFFQQHNIDQWKNALQHGPEITLK